ncbi:PF11070 family protein [Eubacterium nodatum ATCC 33099]|nr:PF11070 family protein [Eubacterium nodatum ATCC 33099]
MKKKYFNLALIYATAAMIGGVFYREFTKWNGFTGATALGKVHTHLFILGMLVFLLVALFSQSMDLEKQKTFRTFMKIYNIGLPILSIMMVVRGVIQVLEFDISSRANSAISGVAGAGHVLVGIGIVLLLLTLKKSAKE